MKNIFMWLSDHWLKLVGYIIVSIAIIFFVTIRLGNLVVTPSQSNQARSSSTNLQSIIDNPLYAPHKVSQLVVQKVLEPTSKNMQLVSIGFGLLSIMALYLFLRNWRTERIAVFGTVLFASSSWFLHLSRRTTPFISTTLFVLALATWMYQVMYHKDHPKLLLFSGAILIALGLYQPGVIWFVSAFLVWHLPKLVRVCKQAGWLAVLGAVAIVLAGIVPLVYGFMNDPKLLLQWGLLPQQLPDLASLPKDFLNVPAALVWHSEADPTYGLGNLPLLDAFSFVMFILGLYQCWRRLSKRGMITATVAFAVAWTLLAFTDRATYMMVALPFVYLAIAAGVTILLQQWFTVFPRNPLARNVGVAVLAIAVGITSFYHLTRYYVAWPNAPETKAAFTSQEIQSSNK